MNPHNPLELTTQAEREAMYTERTRKDKAFVEKMERLTRWERRLQTLLVFLGGMVVGMVVVMLVG